MGLTPQVTFGGGIRGWIGDSPFILLDTARIRSLGWKPELTVRQGVEKTIEFLQLAET
jgi:UDP-glucose 4-epimerase